MQEKWDGKVKARYIFQNKCSFPIFFCPLFWGMWKLLLLLYSIYISIFYFWVLQCTDKFSSWNHQAYWKKKKWSKCYLTTSNILKKLVWLLSFWIEYGNNCQLLFFPESKFNAYLCNLRWHHNRFQTLRRCYRGIFNFRHWKFGKLMSWVLLTSMPIFRLVEFVELQN